MLKKLIKILITGVLIIGLFELTAWAKERITRVLDLAGHDILNANIVTAKITTSEVTTVSGDLTLNATGSNIILSSKKLTSPATITRRQLIPASNFGKNPDNPPAIGIYGICQALKFTVDTDKAYYKLPIPDDYAGGDLSIRVAWTRSTTGSDESGKTVKWQLKYLAINGIDENCNSGESTLSIQDTYDSASTTDQIVYRTDAMIIPSTDFSTDELIIIELMAITPTGTALSKPACIGLAVFYTAYQVIQ